jgi:peptide chain release factor subunit 1
VTETVPQADPFPLDLRSLAEMHGPERAFVSCYLAGPDSLSGLGQRERKLDALLADSPDEQTHFRESMRLLRGWIDENPPGPTGSCAFACWALDYAGGALLPVSVPDDLRLGSSPHIRPLAEMRDEYESFVVVAADNRGTRILLVTAEAVRDLDHVRGGVKNRVRKGGWSQARYARRREKELLHYAKEVEEVLSDLTREERFRRIVLLGSREALDEIEGLLPPALARLVVGKQTVNLKDGDDALLDKAYGFFFAEERESERSLWEAIRDRLFGGGLAVAGADEVLRAALEGRVDRVIVTRDAKIPGTRCRACDRPSAGVLARCPACGGEDVFEVDVVNAVARQAELTRASVEFCDPIPGLVAAGHVAALLRY